MHKNYSPFYLEVHLYEQLFQLYSSLAYVISMDNVCYTDAEKYNRKNI